MNAKLFRVPFTYVGTDKKEHIGYNFYLCFENNRIVRVNAHKYKKADGTWNNDSERDLFTLSLVVDSYENIKY